MSIRDSYDMFTRPERERFGDNESASSGSSSRVNGASNLVDLDCVLHNDNPNKKAIAVSYDKTTPFERWVWLPRSQIEYEKTGIGRNGEAKVRVTMPEHVAKAKGLI